MCADGCGGRVRDGSGRPGHGVSRCASREHVGGGQPYPWWQSRGPCPVGRRVRQRRASPTRIRILMVGQAALGPPHALATEGGMSAYRDGGTAIDAAIAAAAVLTVVYPHNVALGGDLIALVRTPDGTVHCINASGWAGAAADVRILRARHGRSLPARGVDAVTVPGGIRGWEVLRSFGARLTWDRTLESAEATARAGVPVAPSLATHIADAENADLFGSEDFDRVFHPDGRSLKVGDELVQPALADTFAALRRHGPGEFYDGELAEQTVAYLRSRGSDLVAEDFAEFEPETVEPISVDFGD